jgi:hypothetical protein
VFSPASSTHYPATFHPLIFAIATVTSVSPTIPELCTLEGNGSLAFDSTLVHHRLNGRMKLPFRFASSNITITAPYSLNGLRLIPGTDCNAGFFRRATRDRSHRRGARRAQTPAPGQTVSALALRARPGCRSNTAERRHCSADKSMAAKSAYAASLLPQPSSELSFSNLASHSRRASVSIMNAVQTLPQPEQIPIRLTASQMLS